MILLLIKLFRSAADKISSLAKQLDSFVIRVIGFVEHLVGVFPLLSTGVPLSAVETFARSVLFEGCLFFRKVRADALFICVHETI